MKILSKMCAAVAAALLVSSCGMMGGMTKTEPTASYDANQTISASANGQASGAALKSLYAQYKTDGKVDMKNLNNIMNVVALANGIQGLKGQTDKSAFYKDFAAGLILGSNNLVTNKNSSAVTGLLGTLANNNLSALTGLATGAVNNAANNAASAAATAAGNAATTLSNISEKTEGVANTISTLSTIFGMLKQ